MSRLRDSCQASLLARHPERRCVIWLALGIRCQANLLDCNLKGRQVCRLGHHCEAVRRAFWPAIWRTHASSDPHGGSWEACILARHLEGRRRDSCHASLLDRHCDSRQASRLAGPPSGQLSGEPSGPPSGICSRFSAPQNRDAVRRVFLPAVWRAVIRIAVRRAF